MVKKGIRLIVGILLAGLLFFGLAYVISYIEFKYTQPPAEPKVIAIIFDRSGGFAGVDEKWTIYTDGSTEYENRKTGKLVKGHVSAQEVANLLEFAYEEGFFSLEKHEYLPPTICCDRFSYTITVLYPHPRCPDLVWKTVMAMDGADAPEGLWRIMGELNNLVSSVDTPDSKCVGEMEELKLGQQCCPGLQPQHTKLGKVLCVPPGVLVD